MTLVISGGSGVLGNALAGIFPKAWRPTRREMDLLDTESIRRYLEAHRPSEVIHAAALTDLQRCEKDRDLARRVNVDGTVALLGIAREVAPDCFFLYVSTAGVFRGDTGGYDEDARPDPINEYGLSKLEGERRVLQEAGTCVVRTNFVRRGTWPHPAAFTDRFGTYLYDTGAATGIADLLVRRMTGIVHVCGDRRMSLFELARRTDPSVRPITMADRAGVPLGRDLSLVTKRWHPYALDT